MQSGHPKSRPQSPRFCTPLPALPEPVNLLAELNKIKWKLECGSFETAFDLHSQVVGIWRQCLVKVCLMSCQGLLLPSCLVKVSLCPHPSVDVLYSYYALTYLTATKL